MELKRKDLADKFSGYHIKNNINDVESANNYLDSIIEYLNFFEYKSNDNFVFLGRKKFIYDEIVDILNGKTNVDKPIYFVLGSLDEFMCNSNFIYPSEDDYMNNREKNDKYMADGNICLEEKNCITNIINLMREKLLNKTDYTNEKDLTTGDLTKEEAIKLYVEKFGGYPEYLFMGASEETIKNKIIEALKSGKEITAEDKDVDY